MRPGLDLDNDSAAQHPSETEQAQIQADYTIENTGTLDDLRRRSCEVRDLILGGLL